MQAQGHEEALDCTDKLLKDHDLMSYYKQIRLFLPLIILATAPAGIDWIFGLDKIVLPDCPIMGFYGLRRAFYLLEHRRGEMDS
jgi:hypothetical protein